MSLIRETAGPNRAVKSPSEPVDLEPVDSALSAGRMRLRTLTAIRWVALAGQTATVLVVHFGLGFDLPLLPVLVVIAASATLNLVLSLGWPARARLTEESAVWYLGFDIVQLATLLYLTGGLANPFALLLLAPVTVSATVLTLNSTIALSALTIGCVSVLVVWRVPLPWMEDGFSLPLIYLMGSWSALVVGIGFFAAYTWRVAEEARRMSDALAATHLALSREQQLSALGGLAAAAAHELGSPLGTIAVTVREIARDLAPESPIAEDVGLLISEVQRCREILAELSRQPDDEDDEDSPFSRLPIDALVEAAAAPHGDERIENRFEVAGDHGAAPIVIRSPEIIHGLGNLIQNAIQFARHLVVIRTSWTDDSVLVTVSDDGPGFSSRLLQRLGEPYISGRNAEGGHMGLGIFIAQTLLQRTGAELEFGNRPEGGAEVSVRWNRRRLEAGPPERRAGISAHAEED
jgi:two-component system, sensor histidine kinase RegB